MEIRLILTDTETHKLLDKLVTSVQPVPSDDRSIRKWARTDGKRILQMNGVTLNPNGIVKEQVRNLYEENHGL